MQQPKQALRARGLDERRKVSPKAAAAFSEHLAAEGLAIATSLGPKVISAYFPLADEPSTLPLLKSLAKAGFQTALPVTGKFGTALIFRLWRPGGPTIRGKMAIEEPLATAQEVAPDLLFVPLAAFDRSGHRLGYGAGFYDRTLSTLRGKKPICAIGVAYAAQELSHIPFESHDERLDYVLTERELINCRAG
jgi:5-formyltetrahydrofolate cyclo-ligase